METLNVKVKNVISSRGSETPNQFIIETGEGRYFQSYNSVIAFIPFNGKVKLDSHYWDYSKTTGKYRNIFLGENKTETEKKIKNGIYELVNLNN